MTSESDDDSTYEKDEIKVYDEKTGKRIKGLPGEIMKLSHEFTNAFCFHGAHKACPGRVLSKTGPYCVCPCHDAELPKDTQDDDL